MVSGVSFSLAPSSSLPLSSFPSLFYPLPASFAFFTICHCDPVLTGALTLAHELENETTELQQQLTNVRVEKNVLLEELEGAVLTSMFLPLLPSALASFSHPPPWSPHLSPLLPLFLFGHSLDTLTFPYLSHFYQLPSKKRKKLSEKTPNLKKLFLTWELQRRSCWKSLMVCKVLCSFT